MYKDLLMKGAIASVVIGGALAYYLLVRRDTRRVVDILASSTSKTAKDMVDQLIKLDIIKDKRVAATMLKVNRANYVPSDCTTPYIEAAVPIGFNATISAPHMHGIGLDILSSKLTTGANVLDVGCGSGYISACLADLVAPSGRVYGLDHVRQLVTQAELNIRADNPSLFERITLVVTDGFQGLPEHAPFDAIYVGAACPAIPKSLVDQLKPGGRLVIPVGPPDGFHNLVVVDKNLDGKEEIKNMGPVRFVPLQSYEKQIQGSTIGLTKVIQGGDGENILMRTQYYPAPDTSPEEIKILQMQLTRPL